MPEFIVQPPKKSKIPSVTLRQLADALALYLPTVSDFTFSWWDFEGDRADRSTMLFLRGKKASDPTVSIEMIVDIYEKAATSEGARLSSEPFVVWVRSKDILIQDLEKGVPTNDVNLLITPREDRSIVIS